ncbi:MAG: cellulase family glycosylhydrolase [Candidatus Omnitrophica bacterium]|nr:cellulase family glycosylhydrolase [Candidatus Omnitrophota bacterium]
MDTIEKVSKIRGLNLGSWLLMEGYILGGRNIAESLFKDEFKKTLGVKQLKDFERLFRNHFINEDDFKTISCIGANTLRIPFNHRLLEKKPFSYSQEGFAYLDRAFDWAEKYNLGIILDLHAAAGAQNCDWHSDSSGKAMLFKSKILQKRTICLWQVIADRYKDKKGLIGYDFLNEPVLGSISTKVLKGFYSRLLKAVRSIDKESLIFLEGDVWAQKIDFLADLIQRNVAVSIHAYQPLSYVFNFTPFLRFPAKIENYCWNSEGVKRYLRPYYEFSKKNKVGIYVGEFGINWRGGFWGEDMWLQAMLKAFIDYRFGFTYWTYKAIAQYNFPDGLYQFIEDSRYINRAGPVIGWQTYPKYWKKDKEKIVDFWKTVNYTPNSKLLAILRRYWKNDHTGASNQE